MTKNITALVVIGVILLVGAFLAYRAYQTKPTNISPTPSNQVMQPTPETTPSTTVASPSAQTQNMVTVTKTGFSPQSITIKVGESVTWINNDSVTHNVSSAAHPTHLVYPPLNLGDFAASQKVSLTFPKAGTYKYHDHINATLFGSVIVQ